MTRAAGILSWTAAALGVAAVASSAVGLNGFFWLVPCGIAAAGSVYCLNKTKD
jgi:hypothetical protein